MRSTLFVTASLVVLAAATFPPLAAQEAKPRRASPTLMTNPAAPTPPAPPAAPATADSNATKARRPSPTLVNRPGVTADSSRTAGRNAAANQAVAPQAARRAPVAAFTAGLAMEPYSSADDAARQLYIAQFTQRLDSTIATLIGVFRGTTGQPLAGAESPAALSQRERDRWSRCRDLHYDLQSYASAMHDLVGELPEDPAVQRSGGALDSALTALQATSGCDDVSSMIAAPDRWTPWASQYQTTARTFYVTWYGQVREVADRNRALVIALNATLPAAERMPVPPGIARTAPYAGAGPR
jgi:hypothetical protein